MSFTLTERLEEAREVVAKLEELIERSRAIVEAEQASQFTQPAQPRFERCLEFVLEWEGGYVNNPNDPGGPTNKGITLQTYRDWVDRPVDAMDLQSINPGVVAAIYKEHYWDVIRGDDLPIGVDLAVFDMAVHSGPARSVVELQRVLGVTDDGIVGPVTLRAAGVGAPKAIAFDHVNGRRSFLGGLSTWKTFGPGWTNRLDDLTQQIKEDTQA